MTIKILETLGQIEPAQWNALQPSSVFLEHGFLAALELSGSLAHNGFASRHVTLWDDTQLLAALPCYLKRDEACDALPDWAAQVARKNDLPYDPTLFIGVPFVRAGGRKLLARADVDRAAAMAQLIAAAKDTIKDAPSPVIHYYFSTEEEVGLLATAGFHRRTSARNAWRNRGYASFDAFLGELRSSRRLTIRKERKAIAAADLQFEIVHGSELTDDLMDVVWRLHHHTVEKYGRTADRLTRPFFTQLRERLSDRLEVLLVERGGNPVAGVITAASGGSMYPLYWGALEDIPYLTFEMVYQLIEQAIARELEWIDLGGTMAYQLQRGFVPVGVDHSATWVGEEALDEAFGVLAAKERAWTPRDIEDKLRVSPYRSDRAAAGGEDL